MRKLGVALSGITDSSWVVADNHAGYGVHPSLTRSHAACGHVQGRREQPYQCHAVKAQANSCSYSMRCRRNGCSTCLTCFLWVEQARHAARDSKAMLSGQLAEGRYVHTRCAYRHAPAPLGLVGSKELGQSWPNIERNNHRICENKDYSHPLMYISRLALSL